MATATSERLLNLVIALRQRARTPLWIIDHVGGYSTADSTEAAQLRKLYRDIETLKDLGIDVSENTVGALSLTSPRHPDIQFTPQEVGVIALAAEFALSGDLARVARHAWGKLAAAGMADDELSVRGTSETVDISAHDISELLRAATEQLKITFDYYPTAHSRPQQRTVEPWAVIAYQGRWYMPCWDTDRKAPRTFRVSKINSITVLDRPALHSQERQNIDPHTMVEEAVRGMSFSSHDPIIFTTHGPAHPLTRLASRDGQSWIIPPHVLAELGDDLVDLFLEYCDHVTVESPQWLRDDITESLTTLLSHCDKILPFKPPRGLTPLATSLHPQPKAPSSGRTAAASELIRLMSISPFLKNNPGISLYEAAQGLGTTPDQLRQDLQTLTFCGRPGLGGGDLININLDPRNIYLIDDQGLGAPVSITPREAAVLLLALETVDSIPGIGNADVLAHAASKIRAYAGPDGQGVLDTPNGGNNTVVEHLRTALRQANRIRINYTDKNGETDNGRTLDPGDLIIVDGEFYLRALDSDVAAAIPPPPARWRAHITDNIRTFRVDRITEVTVLPEAAATRRIAQAVGSVNPGDPFGFHESRQWHRVWLPPQATWIADYDQVWVVRSWNRGLIVDVPGDPTWVRRWILGHRGSVVPLEPAEFAQDVCAVARDACRTYRPEDSE